MATEEMAYELVETKGDAELRQYAPSIVAETKVSGRFEWVGNIAFGRLAGYIFGRNRGQRQMAMTAPVIQSAEPEKIAMAAPVLQEPKRGRSWVVSFVMPAEYTMETLPEPGDAKVRLSERPGQLMMALRYAGGWRRSLFERNRQKLAETIEREGLVATGPAVFARYDPPSTPWFRRRNEVLIPVEAA
jgi:hypothetical protein